MNAFTSQEIAQKFKIGRPLDWCYVTQPFGANWVDFYKKLGLKGHDGTDCKAQDGTPCYACFDGEVLWAGEYEGYGVNIWLKTWVLIGNLNIEIEAIYGHLKEVKVKAGDRVSKGELIGFCDNTGKYTTGNHLHFGIRPKYPDGYEQNGYHGWIDPAPLFEDKGWDLLPVEKRYLRFYKEDDPKWRPWSAYQSEVRTALALWRKLKRKPNNQEILAATYGGWDWESVANPGLFPIWAVMKKDEYIKGQKLPLILSI